MYAFVVSGTAIILEPPGAIIIVFSAFSTETSAKTSSVDVSGSSSSVGLILLVFTDAMTTLTKTGAVVGRLMIVGWSGSASVVTF